MNHGNGECQVAVDLREFSNAWDIVGKLREARYFAYVVDDLAIDSGEAKKRCEEEHRDDPSADLERKAEKQKHGEAEDVHSLQS